MIAGVDGCSGGWIAVVREGRRRPRAFLGATFAEVAAHLDGADAVAVDMPIGLPARRRAGGRACDRAARRLLGPRASSVFSPPTRRQLQARSFGRVRGLWRSLDFRWQMVLRGFFRHRLRSVAGITAATVGSALLLMTFYFRDALIEMIEFQFDKVLVSDFDLTFKDERDFGVVFEASHLPGVDHVEPVFSVACTFHHGHRRKKGAVTGLVPGATLTSPRDTEGRKVPVPKAGLLLTVLVYIIAITMVPLMWPFGALP